MGQGQARLYFLLYFARFNRKIGKIFSRLPRAISAKLFPFKWFLMFVLISSFDWFEGFVY
jgi:hypothetical protein